ncbi:MAG: DUF4831 family protein [Candidatus Azobacteroides sp.]|nr:DUF4831 family protein [Candidatus Azobacteroides sp.]
MRTNTQKFLLLAAGVFSLANPLFAQTKVVKVNALEANNYGIQYMLPKTIFKIEVEYNEIRQKAGPYAKYASRYLGIDESNIIMEDRTYYTLGDISLTETGVPNKDQTYLIFFKTKTFAPFAYLTEDGVICSINAEYPDEPVYRKTAPAVSPSNTSNTPAANPQSVFTEEYLRAGSASKMAEVAAKNIYKIRESRQDILTGDVENVPKDGEAMKIILSNLDLQERLWTELFTGSSETIKRTKQLTVEPSEEWKQKVLFRFSTYYGAVDADDLSGRPIYIQLKDLNTREKEMSEIEESGTKKKPKEAESIVYNLPGQAEVNIYDGTKKIYSITAIVTQFGSTQVLSPSLLENKKALIRIYFYPNTGAIKQIIQ